MLNIKLKIDKILKYKYLPSSELRKKRNIEVWHRASEGQKMMNPHKH